MDTLAALREISAFARAMTERAPPVDLVLPALRGLLAAADVVYRIVGGVAVLHHGYVRSTRDVAILVGPEALAQLERRAATHGFELVSPTRLRHVRSGVQVDILYAGAPIPRSAGRYPDPASLGTSRSEPDFVDLEGLILLKLEARRHQDQADVVALLKAVPEGRYLQIEAGVPAELRPALADLWRDAQEEKRWSE